MKVSAFDSKNGLVVIKPSGVAYDHLSPENMVIVDMSVNIIEGTLKPSSDTATHLEIYKSFPEIKILSTHTLNGRLFGHNLGKTFPR